MIHDPIALTLAAVAMLFLAAAQDRYAAHATTTATLFAAMM